MSCPGPSLPLSTRMAAEINCLSFLSLPLLLPSSSLYFRFLFTIDFFFFFFFFFKILFIDYM